MTFASFHEHSSPIFRKLNVIKLNDLILSAFDAFFSKVSEIQYYNTRSAAKQSYYLFKARTNYGKFNISRTKDLELN